MDKSSCPSNTTVQLILIVRRNSWKVIPVDRRKYLQNALFSMQANVAAWPRLRGLGKRFVTPLSILIKRGSELKAKRTSGGTSRHGTFDARLIAGGVRTATSKSVQSEDELDSVGRKRRVCCFSIMAICLRYLNAISERSNRRPIAGGMPETLVRLTM
jgi:hypothetical protein